MGLGEQALVKEIKEILKVETLYFGFKLKLYDKKLSEKLSEKIGDHKSEIELD